LNVFAAFAQFELEIMKERQREGIADAKAAGRYKGRKPTARAKAADAVRLFKEGKRVFTGCSAARDRACQCL
jgi:DNA invertase Pin-like site-specific DNA recombinase